MKIPTKNLLNFVYNLKEILIFSDDKFIKIFLHYIWVEIVIKKDRMDIKIILNLFKYKVMKICRLFTTLDPLFVINSD